MATYTGIALSTLQEALALAQVALLKMERGEGVASIATADKRIGFVATTPAALKVHIRELQAAISALTSTTPRKAYSVATWTR